MRAGKKKLFFVFLALVFSLACLGQAGAFWQEGLAIEGVGFAKKVKPRPGPAVQATNENGNVQAAAPPIIPENTGSAQETGPVLKNQNRHPIPVLNEIQGTAPGGDASVLPEAPAAEGKAP